MVETVEKKIEQVDVSQPKLVSLAKEWPYRLIGNAFLLLVIFLLSFVIVTIKNNLVSKKFADVTQEFYVLTSKIGFNVDDIIVEGREKVSKQEILDVIAVNRNNNLLELNVNDIKAKIEALPWVSSAIVKKSFFPNILHISLKEREVMAIWQFSDKFYPIDFQGNVIDADFRPLKQMLLIVGDKAPQNINQLLEDIQGDNEILKRIKVANYISHRRWNLILDDIKEGITIKLPEDDIKNAWEKLLKLNATKGILKRKLTFIDLRLKDKVIVKLHKSEKNEEMKLKNDKERKL